MARVAEATCATCSHIKPRNEMREVAVNRRVGTTFGISHSRRSTRERASVQFRRQMVWVCRDCKAPKSDGLIPWKTLLVLAVVLIGWLYFAGSKAPPALPKAARAVSATLAPSEDDVTMSTPMDNPDATPVSKSHENNLRDDAQTQPDDKIEPVAETFDWTRPEIADAQEKALGQDDAVSWKADGVKGQAVASAASTSEGGECRNVYATAKKDGETLQSPTTTWCRQGGGEWNPR